MMTATTHAEPAMLFVARPTLLAALLASAVAASAQTSAPPAAAKLTAKPATILTKPAAKKPTAAAPAEPELPAASAEQIEAFERAYLGDYACEFKQSVHLTPLEGKPGYLSVVWNKLRVVMKPVLSATGALRLEDVTGRTLMLQIGNKSMLFDTKAGQRLVDDCVHPEQAKIRQRLDEEARKNPEEAAKNGLGIVK